LKKGRCNTPCLCLCSMAPPTPPHRHLVRQRRLLQPCCSRETALSVHKLQGHFMLAAPDLCWDAHLADCCFGGFCGLCLCACGQGTTMKIWPQSTMHWLAAVRVGFEFCCGTATNHTVHHTVQHRLLLHQSQGSCESATLGSSIICESLGASSHAP